MIKNTRIPAIQRYVTKIISFLCENDYYQDSQKSNIVKLIMEKTENLILSKPFEQLQQEEDKKLFNVVALPGENTKDFSKILLNVQLQWYIYENKNEIVQQTGQYLLDQEILAQKQEESTPGFKDLRFSRTNKNQVLYLINDRCITGSEDEETQNNNKYKEGQQGYQHYQKYIGREPFKQAQQKQSLNQYHKLKSEFLMNIEQPPMQYDDMYPGANEQGNIFLKQSLSQKQEQLEQKMQKQRQKQILQQKKMQIKEQQYYIQKQQQEQDRNLQLLQEQQLIQQFEIDQSQNNNEQDKDKDNQNQNQQQSQNIFSKIQSLSSIFKKKSSDQQQNQENEQQEQQKEQKEQQEIQKEEQKLQEENQQEILIQSKIEQEKMENVFQQMELDLRPDQDYRQFSSDEGSISPVSRNYQDIKNQHNYQNYQYQRYQPQKSIETHIHVQGKQPGQGLFGGNTKANAQKLNNKNIFGIALMENSIKDLKESHMKENGIIEWNIFLENMDYTVGFGIAKKSIVEQYDYNFDQHQQDQKSGHGVYMVSYSMKQHLGGYSWNNSVEEQNHKKIEIIFKSRDTITIQYDTVNKILTIIKNGSQKSKNTVKIDIKEDIDDEQWYPCVLPYQKSVMHIINKDKQQNLLKFPTVIKDQYLRKLYKQFLQLLKQHYEDKNPEIEKNQKLLEPSIFSRQKSSKQQQLQQEEKDILEQLEKSEIPSENYEISQENQDEKQKILKQNSDQQKNQKQFDFWKIKEECLTTEKAREREILRVLLKQIANTDKVIIKMNRHTDEQFVIKSHKSKKQAQLFTFLLNMGICKKINILNIKEFFKLKDVNEKDFDFDYINKNSNQGQEDFIWYWNSRMRGEPEYLPEWKEYNQCQQEKINQAYQRGEAFVKLDSYKIDFNSMLQIHIREPDRRQRPVKKVSSDQDNNEIYSNNNSEKLKIEESEKFLANFALSKEKQQMFLENPDKFLKEALINNEHDLLQILTEKHKMPSGLFGGPKPFGQKAPEIKKEEIENLVTLGLEMGMHFTSYQVKTALKNSRNNREQALDELICGNYDNLIGMEDPDEKKEKDQEKKRKQSSSSRKHKKKSDNIKNDFDIASQDELDELYDMEEEEEEKSNQDKQLEIEALKVEKEQKKKIEQENIESVKLYGESMGMEFTNYMVKTALRRANQNQEVALSDLFNGYYENIRDTEDPELKQEQEEAEKNNQSEQKSQDQQQQQEEENEEKKDNEELEKQIKVEGDDGDGDGSSSSVFDSDIEKDQKSKKKEIDKEEKQSKLGEYLQNQLLLNEGDDQFMKILIENKDLILENKFEQEFAAGIMYNSKCKIVISICENQIYSHLKNPENLQATYNQSEQNYNISESNILNIVAAPNQTGPSQSLLIKEGIYLVREILKNDSELFKEILDQMKNQDQNQNYRCNLLFIVYLLLGWDNLPKQFDNCQISENEYFVVQGGQGSGQQDCTLLNFKDDKNDQKKLIQDISSISLEKLNKELWQNRFQFLQQNKQILQDNFNFEIFLEFLKKLLNQMVQNQQEIQQNFILNSVLNLTDAFIDTDIINNEFQQKLLQIINENKQTFMKFLKNHHKQYKQDNQSIDYRIRNIFEQWEVYNSKIYFSNEQMLIPSINDSKLKEELDDFICQEQENNEKQQQQKEEEKQLEEEQEDQLNLLDIGNDNQELSQQEQKEMLKDFQNLIILFSGFNPYAISDLYQQIQKGNEDNNKMALYFETYILPYHQNLAPLKDQIRNFLKDRDMISIINLLYMSQEENLQGDLDYDQKKKKIEEKIPNINHDCNYLTSEDLQVGLYYLAKTNKLISPYFNQSQIQCTFSEFLPVQLIALLNANQTKKLENLIQSQAVNYRSKAQNIFSYHSNPFSQKSYQPNNQIQIALVLYNDVVNSQVVWSLVLVNNLSKGGDSLKMIERNLPNSYHQPIDKIKNDFLDILGHQIIANNYSLYAKLSNSILKNSNKQSLQDLIQTLISRLQNQKGIKQNLSLFNWQQIVPSAIQFDLKEKSQLQNICQNQLQIYQEFESILKNNGMFNLSIKENGNTLVKILLEQIVEKYNKSYSSLEWQIILVIIDLITSKINEKINDLISNQNSNQQQIQELEDLNSQILVTLFKKLKQFSRVSHVCKQDVILIINRILYKIRKNILLSVKLHNFDVYKQCFAQKIRKFDKIVKLQVLTVHEMIQLEKDKIDNSKFNSQFLSNYLEFVSNLLVIRDILHSKFQYKIIQKYYDYEINEDLQHFVNIHKFLIEIDVQEDIFESYKQINNNNNNKWIDNFNIFKNLIVIQNVPEKTSIQDLTQFLSQIPQLRIQKPKNDICYFEEKGLVLIFTDPQEMEIEENQINLQKNSIQEMIKQSEQLQKNTDINLNIYQKFQANLQSKIRKNSSNIKQNDQQEQQQNLKENNICVSCQSQEIYQQQDLCLQCFHTSLFIKQNLPQVQVLMGKQIGQDINNKMPKIYLESILYTRLFNPKNKVLNENVGQMIEVGINNISQDIKNKISEILEIKDENMKTDIFSKSQQFVKYFEQKYQDNGPQIDQAYQILAILGIDLSLQFVEYPVGQNIQINQYKDMVQIVNSIIQNYGFQNNTPNKLFKLNINNIKYPSYESENNKPINYPKQTFNKFQKLQIREIRYIWQKVVKFNQDIQNIQHLLPINTYSISDINSNNNSQQQQVFMSLSQQIISQHKFLWIDVVKQDLLRTILNKTATKDLTKFTLCKTNVFVSLQVDSKDKSQTKTPQFIQAYESLKDVDRSELRPIYPDKHGQPFVAFDVLMSGSLGEGIGLYYELFSEISADLKNINTYCKQTLDLLELNQFTNEYMINPKANTLYDIELYEFLGLLMGCCIRTGVHISVDMPKIFWKSLVEGEQIPNQDWLDFKYKLQDGTEEDIFNGNLLKECIKHDYYEHLDDRVEFINQYLRKNSKYYKEFIPNSENLFSEFLPLYQRALLNQYQKQIDAIKRGLESIVPKPYLSITSSQYLEDQVCGIKKIDLEYLKKNTQYEGYEQNGNQLSVDSKRVQFLWQALEEDFKNEEDRRKFIKFTIGDERLPDFKKSGKPFKIQAKRCKDNQKIDQVLPTSSICFFMLKLPDYSTKEILVAQLNEAICGFTQIAQDAVVDL